MSDNDGKYNGYTNWQTWLVGSEIDNDQDKYRSWQYEAALAPSAEALARVLQDHFEEQAEEQKRGDWMDCIIDEAINNVNWLEIANDIKGEADEDDDEDEEGGDEPPDSPEPLDSPERGDFPAYTHGIDGTDQAVFEEQVREQYQREHEGEE